MVAVGGAALDGGRHLAGRGGETIAEATRWLDGRAAEARYVAAERAVTNWRVQTAMALEPTPVAALAAIVDADGPVVTRCVKLNNYWCVKSARWDGELGTDDEGHVGFASAEHGADAAAVLLRRYYLEFGRKSALDIVRRWAPAECNLTAGAGPGTISIGPLTVRGIGATVRARWLASHRKVRIAAAAPTTTAPPPRPADPPDAASPRPRAPRVSAVIALNPRPSEDTGGAGEARGLTLWRSLPYRVARPRPSRAARPATFREPAVSPSAGEGRGLTISSALPYRVAPPPRPPASSRPAAAAQPATTASVAPAPALPPAPACTPDEQRLRNYAGRIADPLGVGPADDLKLFAADGTPTANLAPVLLAMSAFELGTLHASSDLVDGAVERQVARAKSTPEQVGPLADER